MRHHLVAVAALLGIAAGFVQADYVIIRVNLAQLAGFTGEAKETKENKDDPAKKDKNAELTITAFVEYDRAVDWDESHRKMQHRWGSSFLVTDPEKKVILLTEVVKKMPRGTTTIVKRYHERLDQMRRDPARTAKSYLDLAVWAVNNGQLDEVLGLNDKLGRGGMMEEFLTQDAKGDAQVVAAQKACRAVKDKLKAVVPPDGPDAPASVWKKRLSGPGQGKVFSYSSDHYTVLYDSTDATAKPIVGARAEMLERNFRQFYYWFALRGKVLPMPETRLVALAIDNPRDFKMQHKIFDSVPHVADGFYAPRENLIVFSTVRMDGGFEALDRLAKEKLQEGWDFRKILTPGTHPFFPKGGLPKGWPPREAMQNPANYPEIAQTIAYNQTLALLHRALSDEADLAVISHEGTRQLLTASGLLPQAVLMPEWVQFGLPSVFETPKYEPFSQTGAFWPTFGEGHWTYLVYFKLWEQGHSPLLDKPEDALKAVVTDRYFHEAEADAKNPDKMIRAHVLAWSLCYYLTARHIDGLLRYAEELNALPRDLELDDETHLACFVRAFDLGDKDKPGAIDAFKWSKFAGGWFEEMRTKALPLPQTLKEAENSLKERRESLLPPK